MRRALHVGTTTAVVLAVVVGAGVGIVRGVLDDPPRSDFHYKRPCSDRSDGPGETLTIALRFEGTDRTALEPRVRRTAVVPISFWEVNALQAPSATTGLARQASHCILGAPSTQPPKVTIADGMATITSTAEEARVGNCAGPWYIERDLRAFDLRLRTSGAGPCIKGPETGGGTTNSSPIADPVVDLRLEVGIGSPAVRARPAPVSDDDAIAVWRRPPKTAPLTIDAEVRLSRISFVAVVIDEDHEWSLSIGDSRLSVRLGAMVIWVTELVLLLVLAFVIGRRRRHPPGGPDEPGERREPTWRAVATGVVLIVATTVHLTPSAFTPFDGSAATAVVAGSALALACVIAGPAAATGWRAMLGWAAAGAGLLAAAFAWGHRLDDSAPRHGLVLLLCLGSAAFVVARLIQWVQAPAPRAPRSDVVPWKLVGHTLTVALAGAFTYLVFRSITIAGGVDQEDRTFSFNAGDMLGGLSTLVLIAVLGAAVREVLDRWEGKDLGHRATAIVVLVWAIVALRAPATIAAIELPVGALVGAALLYAVTRPAPAVETSDSVPSSRVRPLIRKLQQPDEGLLLSGGPGGSWATNARAAVEIGAVLAILPVGYFLLTALIDFPDQTFYGPSFINLVAGIALEAARWLGTAFVFGALYQRLPGRQGPVKALVVVAVWFVGAGATELVNRWQFVGTDRGWLFPGLQLIPFLLVLAVALDLQTTVGQGKVWTDLKTKYQLDNTRRWIGYTGPVVLAAIAIVQQVYAGSGTDFVGSVINGIRSATGA